jgi:fructokinase
VGDDPLGHELLERLDALGVGREHIALDPDHATGRSSVEVDAQGVPAFVVHESAAWDFIEFTPQIARVARRADAVCYGTLPQRWPESRRTINLFLSETRPDAIRMFDANLRRPHFSRDVIEASLRVANVLKLNDDELSVLSQIYSLEGEAQLKLRELAERFELHAVALTRGPDGSVVVANGKSVAHDGYPIRVVDTVGAGDAFAAVLIVGLLRGDDIARIARRANRVAAYVCTQPGATPVIPPEILAADP